MKPIYQFSWIAACCLAAIMPLQAQTLIYLGKTTEVVATYQAKAAAAKSNLPEANRKLNHNLPGRPPLVLTLHSRSLEGATQVYSGEVDGEKNSNFFLKVAGKGLSGYILLRARKQAYQYSSNAQGQAYLKEANIHDIVCFDYQPEPPQNASLLNQGSIGLTAASVVPVLESLPGAQGVVLLDFDGQWNFSTYYNLGRYFTAAPAELSTAEIREVWKLISEDYLPFNLNITTSESVYNNAPVNRRTRVIFTPTRPAEVSSEWGGVAYINSFSWGVDVPCFVFNTSIKGAGDGGSHEVGHTLGLSHDGRMTPDEEYYHGQNEWAPIMGSSYTTYQAQWSKGEYASANNTEDDLLKITTQNGFTYRPDDYSADFGAGSTLLRSEANGVVPASLNKGIITTQSDVDVFAFSTSGGPVSLLVNPNPAYANLDVKLVLRNASLAIVTVADPVTIEAAINQILPAGRYYLSVAGVRGALGADSDYGSLGAYSITGTIPPIGAYVMSNRAQSVCNGTFYDPGFLGDYPDNASNTQTFAPSSPNSWLTVTFNAFSLAYNSDFLYIYDGASTTARLLATYTGNAVPPAVTATTLGGRLTFKFVSNSTVHSSGWKATFSCRTLVSTAARLQSEPETEPAALQAYPNPFTDRITLSFTLQESQAARLRVYDQQGREVASLYEGEAQAGQEYTLELAAGSLKGGMYIARLQTNRQASQVKLLLQR